jgi:hypothetical protein
VPAMPDKICDWCGADITDDFKTVDNQMMCLPCVERDE